MERSSANVPRYTERFHDVESFENGDRGIMGIGWWAI
jgi:hypothetical protein